jgi:hypothetical protein
MRGDKTTHILQRVHGHQWELRRDGGNRRVVTMTTITAMSPEAAMVRAGIWLQVHENGLPRGDRWCRSKGYTDRYVLRTTSRRVDRRN